MCGHLYVIPTSFPAFKRLMFISVLLLFALAREEAIAAANTEGQTTPVKVNRTVPQVQPPKAGLEFSASPTTQEIFRARVFEEPLVPIGGEPGAAENSALAAALLDYAKRSGPDDFASPSGLTAAQRPAPPIHGSRQSPGLSASIPRHLRTLD